MDILEHYLSNIYYAGVLVNVDWHTIFRSFYEKVRIQVAVRDPAKIPRDRMVEIHHEL